MNTRLGTDRERPGGTGVCSHRNSPYAGGVQCTGRSYSKFMTQPDKIMCLTHVLI
ncbi:hypothetical protein SAMN05216417_11289 [Nitrosospira multiformis]|uniref:Uncharacterized protein n=1 Tax=Nitrosospira multiformis TaxID=1231 RepID=A0A1I7HXN3_9PROT|nr:hypothetical protein SAMN05216417_11289 [Nitrosospira multiformis]